MKTIKLSISNIVPIADYTQVTAGDVVLSTVNPAIIKRITAIGNVFNSNDVADKIDSFMHQLSLPTIATTPASQNVSAGALDGSLQLPNGNQINCNIYITAGLVIGLSSLCVLQAMAVANFEFVSTFIIDYEEVER